MIRFRDMVTYEKTFSLSQLSRAVKTGYECMHVNAARMSLSIGLVNFLGSFVSSDARPFVTALGNICVNTVLETAQNIANTGGKMKLPLSSTPLLLAAYFLRDGAYGYTMGHLTHTKPEESLVLRVAKSVGAGFVVGVITSPAQVAIKDLLYKGCCKEVVTTFCNEPKSLIPAGLARGFHVAAVISTLTVLRELSSK